MKMKYLNLNLLLLFIVSSLVFTSCKDNDTVAIDEAISTEDAIALTEIDNISDEVDNLIDDFFVASENLSSKGGNPFLSFLSCLQVTFTSDETSNTVTLDFGEGCTLPNGNVLSGIIIMTYTKDTEVKSFTITYTYENFYFNDISIEGTSSILRTRENENGNPESIHTFDIKVTWPDGEFASRNGTKVREWIEGWDTRDWDDNVFLITGNWTATFKDGTVLSVTVTEPLRREMDCSYIVSGILSILKNETTGTLNFGDGTCDNTAIYTNELGEETEIILKGRMQH